MPAIERVRTIRNAFSNRPLQACKFVGILVSLLLGIGGFARVIDARAFTDNPLLGDGQVLAMVLIPLVSLGLVVIVVVETFVAGYHLLRSDGSALDQLKERPVYIGIRAIEAVVAVAGLSIIVTAVPLLVARSTPAPAGVGIMLLLLAVGLGMLATSLVRSGVELFVFG